MGVKKGSHNSSLSPSTDIIPKKKSIRKASTKKTSMPMGNQNGWVDNLNNAPPIMTKNNS